MLCPSGSAHRQVPVHIGGDYEEMKIVPFDPLGGVILPFTHGVAVRDNPGARIQVPQKLRPQSQIDVRVEIEHDHSGLADVGIKRFCSKNGPGE